MIREIGLLQVMLKIEKNIREVMKLQILEVYIESAIMLGDLKDPTYQQIAESIHKYFPDVEVTAEQIESFYLPETQDRIALAKAWGVNY